MRFKDAGTSTAAVVERVLPPSIAREELAKVIGYRENAGIPSSVVPNFIGEKLFDTSGLDFYVAFGVAAGNWQPIGANTLTLTELAFLDGAADTNAVAAKAAILGTGGALTIGGAFTAVTSIGIGNAVLTEAELEMLDTLTAGTATANKAAILGANKNLDVLAVADGGLSLGSGAGTAILATAAEINAAADTSARIVNVTTTPLTVTEALHSGKTLVLDKADGLAITLPAAAPGLKFRFIVKTTITSASTIKSVSGADIMVGYALMGNDTDNSVVRWPAVAGDTADTIDLLGTANSTGGLAGQEIEIEGLAANLWFVKIVGDAGGTEATPFANTVA